MLPAFFRKTILVILSIVLFFGVVISPSHAATSLNTNPDVPNTFHNKTQVVLIELSSALMCQLVGIDIINPTQSCLGVDTTTDKIGYLSSSSRPRVGGALGTLTNMISMTYKLPVKTTDYTSYLASNFGIVKPVYAQSTGFDKLSALMNIWQKVRDLVYLGFVVIFVILGFGVMLRVKLDARTVMTIQNQIPKIILYLILITFSYAIAGLLIDAMWVVTYTGINIISDEVPPCREGGSLATVATNNLMNTPFRFLNQTLTCVLNGEIGINDIAGKVGQTVGDIVTTMLFSVLGIDPDTSCGITNPKGCIHAFLSFLVGVVASLAIVIAILVQLFRLWLNLLKSYLFTILYTIMGPIWILAGLMPGNTNFGFSAWVRRMLFGLSIYPATILLLLLATVLVSDPNISNPNINNTFVPPLIANPAIPNNMGFLIALGVILLAPQVIEMMREVFKAPPSKYAPAIFQALGTGLRPATAVPRTSWKHLTKPADLASGRPAGTVRRVLQGPPVTTTNQYGHTVVDWSKTGPRYKIMNMILGDGAK